MRRNRGFAISPIALLLLTAFMLLGGVCIVYAQTEEKVIVISDRVGEVIDKEERESFGLFEAYKGFKSAVFLELPDSNYVAEITYEENGEEKKSRWAQSEQSIKSLRDYIDNYGGTEGKTADRSAIIGTLRIPDSSHTQIITTTDGSMLVGRIAEIRKNEIDFESKFGKITILISKIKKIKEVPVSSMKEGVYWFSNPNSTRLYFAPTGRCLKKGDAYFADYYLFFTMFAVGVTNNVTLSGGMSILPTPDFVKHNIFVFTPKVALIQRDGGALSVGAMMVKIPDFGDDPAPSVGIVYTVGTLGNPDGSITGGAGYGYMDWKLADKPMLMLGAEKRTSRRTAFVTENWMFPGVEYPMISYGMRFFGEKLSVDLAFFNYFGELLFPGFPYIDFVVKF